MQYKIFYLELPSNFVFLMKLEKNFMKRNILFTKVGIHVKRTIVITSNDLSNSIDDRIIITD